MFATDSDLLDFIPDIFEHGESSWQDLLNEAEAEVKDKIKVEWYNKTRSSTSFDATLLTDAQWKKATIFRALAEYIMPALSKWSPDSDQFRELSAFYRGRFAEELATQFALGIQYDLNDDGTISEGEVHQMQSRLYR